MIEDTIKTVAGTAGEMGESENLRRIVKILDNGPSYIRQRRIFEESKSLKEVAASLVRELEEDLVLYRAKPVYFP